MTNGSYVDLAEVEECQRRRAWDAAARRLFPGLDVQMTGPAPVRGTIDRITLGPAELFTIESAPADVTHRPRARDDVSWTHISLMVQSRGTTLVGQSSGEAILHEGDMCLIDERDRFSIRNRDYCRILFLRLPRGPVMSRHPHLDRLFAKVLPAHESGTRLLSDTLQRLSDVAEALNEEQRASMVGAIVQMLGIAEPLSALPKSPDWRVRRALEFIEMNLFTAGLTAEEVAQDQHISRRRLDQLMQEAVGRTIANHLWQRRMEQAAADLRDPRKSSLSISQIAFANGFEDAAHFTRAFRRRYSVTPGQWRLN
jgi:AraC-like DNA-binding protein